MKKLLLLIPVIALLAAGCAKTEPTVTPQTTTPATTQEAQTPAQTTNTNTPARADVYTNPYGFQLTMPASWKGYKVTQQPMSSNFGAGAYTFILPTTDKVYGYQYEIMIIQVYQPEYWNKVAAEEGPKPVFLGKSSDGWVFTYSRAQDAPSEDLIQAGNDFQKVIASFKVTK